MRKLQFLSTVMAISMAVLSGCQNSSASVSADVDKTESSTEKKDDTNKSAAAQEGNTAQETITLRLATTVQDSMPAGNACSYFCKLIEERSEGRYVVEYYPARQLGETDELLTQVANGTLEMAQISISNVSTFTNLLECLQYPFMLDTYDKEWKALTSSEFQVILNQVDEILGVKNLTVMEHGNRHIANNKHPVKTPEDMEGLKLRVAASGTNFQTIETLGGSPVSMPYGQVYSSLQSKVIDGEEINYTSIYSEKHYEVLKYFTDMPLWPFPAALMMSGDFWNSLSTEDQELFQQAALDSLQYNFDLLNEATEKAQTAMKEAGVELTVIEDASEFKDMVRPIIDEAKKTDPAVEAFTDMCLTLE